MTEDEKECLRAFGMRVRLLRTARRWSQEDLAQRAGITRNAVSSAERAAGEVGLGRVWRLAVGLGVPLPDLVDPDAALAAAGIELVPTAHPNGSHGERAPRPCMTPED